MMGQSASLQSAEDMKLGGAVNMPGGCGAIPTELIRLEKWANKNLIKFNKEKRKALHLRKNNPLYQNMLDTKSLGSSFAE